MFSAWARLLVSSTTCTAFLLPAMHRTASVCHTEWLHLRTNTQTQTVMMSVGDDAIGAYIGWPLPAAAEAGGGRALGEGVRERPKLHRAVTDGDFDAVINLVEGGVDLEAVDPLGRTPLHVAAHTGNKEVLLGLLEAGAKLRAKDVDGRTAMHWAAVGGHAAVVQLLAGAGLEVTQGTKYGETPLHDAAEARDGGGAIRALIDLGAHVNAADYTGNTPLLVAADMSREASVRALLEAGADREARSQLDLETALHVACRNGRIRIVRFFLDGGAVVEAKDQVGGTPLRTAARHGRLEVVKELVSRGADTGGVDNEGLTPVDVAEKYGKKDVVAFLKELRRE